jgi:hypothetical protein
VVKRLRALAHRNRTWESWPMVDGADIPDVLGADILRRLVETAVAVSDGDTPDSMKLSAGDVSFCRDVAGHAEELLA